MITNVNIYNLIPTQPRIIGENLERIRKEFNISKYKYPSVIKYDNSRYLIFNGHHRSYNNYREGIFSFDVNVIEDDISLKNESYSKIQKFSTIDDFIRYYDLCMKEILEHIGLNNVPDFSKFNY